MQVSPRLTSLAEQARRIGAHAPAHALRRIWPLESTHHPLLPPLSAAAHMHIANPRRPPPRPSSSKRCFTDDRANSCRVSQCLDHEAAAAPSHVTSARARGECRRADSDVLSFDDSRHNPPQRYGKRVELQRPESHVRTHPTAAPPPPSLTPHLPPSPLPLPSPPPRCCYSLCPQHTEFRPSIAHTVDIARNASGVPARRRLYPPPP